MKKRDLFWLNRVLLIFGACLIFIVISIYNIVQFNNSYILEEKNELEIYRKQAEFTISFLIKNNDKEQLQKYAGLFENNKEFSFRLFDGSKNLIAASCGSRNKNITANDSRIGKKKYDIWNLYMQSFKDKSLEKVSGINVNGNKYYLETSLSQEFVISSIIKAQKKIAFWFCICLLCLVLGLLHIFYSIRKSFNQLEDSVIKIANGDLNTEIKQSESSLLQELSLAAGKMSEKLKSQIERLTRLEKYRSEFVSNISHEIKTPITAINSAVELIESNTKINAAQKECFEIIKSQTNLINRLIGDILALAEIDLEKTNEHKNFRMINLNNAVKEALCCTAAEVDIKFNYSGSFEVFAVENLVISAVSNLLSNAVKYSESDKIEVNLYQDKNNIVLEVKDYGIGIAEEHLPRIFERFYRADKTRSRKNGGTGLGLAIVKHIIELHNWKIEVQSKINAGSSFKIII